MICVNKVLFPNRLGFELFLHGISCSNIHSRSEKTRIPLIKLLDTYTHTHSCCFGTVCVAFHFSIYLVSVPTENYQPLIFKQWRRLGSAVSYLRVHFRMMTFKVFQSGITVGKFMQILVFWRAFSPLSCHIILYITRK